MKHKCLIATLGLLIIALCVNAQSGRRQVKPPPAAPVPTPTPEPTPSPKKETETELVFLIGSDRNSGFHDIPLTYYDAAQRGCADRLRSRSSADVDSAERDMSRGEAIQKAKSATKTYVVLLTLKFDTMSNSRSWDDLELEFVVFAPGTAKVVTSGRSYLNTNRKGPLVVGRPGNVPGGMMREEWIRNAGEDAADRILKALHMGGPPPR
jgi:hypothetical protein